MFLALVSQFVEALSHWEKILAVVVGLGISFFTIAKGVKFLWTSAVEANKFAKDIINLIPDAQKIAKEFKPNGGKSLKDILSRLENNLSHTDQKIRVMASCLGLASFETDKNGLYVFTSKRWLETTGISFEESIGNGWMNIIQEDDRDFVFKEWMASINQNREFHLTIILQKTSKEISIIAWPIRNLDGTVEKFFGILI